MDARRQQVLHLLVEHFIGANRPIASRDLAEPLGVSSATIRFELAALEEMGLLHQPHTSAGRVPTRDGYRNYAHQFLPPKPLHEAAKARMDAAISRVDGENRLRMAAHIASSLSGYAAVTVLKPRDSKVEAIYLSLLSDDRVLVVVVLEGSVAREFVIDAGFKPERITLERAEEAVRNLKTTVREMPAKLLNLEQQSSPGIGSVLRALRERWGETVQGVNYSSGASQMLMEPESRDADFLRGVLEMLEHPNSSNHNLPPGSVNLSVDDPNGISAVQVGFRSSVGLGSVAIVGPTRMRYPQAISVAKAVSDSLNLA
jgi:heat-inducible transcriptional repressor